MLLTSTVEKFGNRSQPEGMMADAALGTRVDFVMPTKKAAGFPRTARLLRHADFERVYKQGRRHFSASMTFFYWERVEAAAEKLEKKRGGAPAPQVPARQGLRIGFTVGRALGGAVQRNRMKRRLREAVRLAGLPAGVAADVVINPKKALLAADFSAVLNEVVRAFGVIEQNLTSGRRKPEAGHRS